MLGTSCGAVPPPVPTSPADLPPEVRPQVTPGIVLTEVRRIGLPTLDIQIQPAGQTLVNFDTIFYAQEPTFERNVDLLGYDVDIVAEATTYTWHAGDGTTTRTSDPGGPYPNKDVTHRYTRTTEAVSPRVDVTYQVQFRVDGGEWETIDQPLTATGQSATLAVREAAPVLTS
ncbi:hypothetical protein [Solicola sp. PLA-1-18]|uniref:hypothetical protein n=1 Tax=Solicola sp. PLA-1-18 TaxID=3380532 RepID=UPI003B827B63